MSKLIVIDGADGSGKATQVKLLTRRLKEEGLRVEMIDFPRYKNNHFGQLLRECLDGKRGDFMKTDPRIASLLYAADRFESSKDIKNWLDDDVVVVADRYVSANMLHQGAKIYDEKERGEFLAWLDRTEHDVFGIPRPDLIVYLDVPYQTRMKLMGDDSVRSKLDVAEVDERHQTDTEAAAQSLVASYNAWESVSCVEGSEMRTREDIHEDIMEAVKKVLN